LTSSAVDCVNAQRLARRLCEGCERPIEIGREALDAVKFLFGFVPEREWNFQIRVGCDACGGSGYRRRVGLYELMIVTGQIREMILRRALAGEISRVARRAGMVTLREDDLSKAAKGITTIEEVLWTVVLETSGISCKQAMSAARGQRSIRTLPARVIALSRRSRIPGTEQAENGIGGVDSNTRKVSAGGAPRRAGRCGYRRHLARR
jgi:hypothetical protein